MTKIAIFASGSGSNAENIIQYFQGIQSVEIVLVLSNRKDSYVLARAIKYSIPTFVFTKNELNNTTKVLDYLHKLNASILILAGFLLKIPNNLLIEYPNKILNIHPSLLPLYGGKGMYGMNVHRSVVESKDQVSGITIHYVNEHYDQGDYIFQATCPVLSSDSPEDVKQKVHDLERIHYPKIIASILSE
ncbi:MAG: phosphoribosylglycinamide formyltransferase [Flavobacteriales bacterium]|tara:strand:- start:1746 stop:2312 length:567 start_codon:yes stop_codon:yes gene_type:complete